MSQSTLERVAYGAIGAPATAIKQMSKKLDEARSMLETFGDRIADSTRREIEDWAKEGEAIVDRITGRVRKEIPDDLRSSVTTARTRAERIGGTVKDTVETAPAMLTQPTVALSEIKGIGPASAEKLREAGVLTTNALIERVGDNAATERLAETTGLSADKLREWAAKADLTRVKGVGDEYRKLLQWSGVPTIAALAEWKPSDLAATLETKANELDLDMPLPNPSTIQGWITSAKAIAR